MSSHRWAQPHHWDPSQGTCVCRLGAAPSSLLSAPKGYKRSPGTGEGDRGAHESQQAFSKPSHDARPRPWVIQAPVWSPSSPATLWPRGSGPEGPLKIIWPPVPPHLLPVRDLQLSSHPLDLPSRPAPHPTLAHPSQAWLTLSEVWLSGHWLVLRLRQKVNSSLEPLSRASALLRRTWGGT